jgi:hypothetical protein
MRHKGEGERETHYVLAFAGEYLELHEEPPAATIIEQNARDASGHGC